VLIVVQASATWSISANECKNKTLCTCEISGSHSGEYEDGCLLGHHSYHPDDGGSKHLWNVSSFYQTTQPTMQKTAIFIMQMYSSTTHYNISITEEQNHDRMYNHTFGNLPSLSARISSFLMCTISIVDSVLYSSNDKVNFFFCTSLSPSTSPDEQVGQHSYLLNNTLLNTTSLVSSLWAQVKYIKTV
jgi:hypothetical protein